jgi:hypothetical protein
MTRTVDELTAQVARLRGYMGHFKNRMEAYIVLAQHSRRDMERVLYDFKDLPAPAKEKIEMAIARIKDVMNAKPGVRLDVEALEATPELIGKTAVVIYFETEADRDELVLAMKATKPFLAVNL